MKKGLNSLIVKLLKRLFNCFTKTITVSPIILNIRGWIIDELEKKLSEKDFEKWLDTNE